MRASTMNLADLANSVLAEVEQAETVKQAELSAVHEATPVSDLKAILLKIASDIREHATDVTYDDLSAYQDGRL